MSAVIDTSSDLSAKTQVINRLADHYFSMSSLWRDAARGYIERAKCADRGIHDNEERVTWDELARRASTRACRYARLGNSVAAIARSA